MKKYICLVFIVLTTSLINGQSKIKKDTDAILKMCGCFQIEFNFTETFKYTNKEDYKPSNDYFSTALELAIPIKNEKGNISIQHLLIVGDNDQKYIIKHWRQDWIFQNQNLFNYIPENQWTFSKIKKNSVKGQWTQKVFQVDDSPRYEGSSSWVHVDGKSYWENTTNAPLPRREYTKRNDYNLLQRTNRHQITNNGWVHIQDNKKINFLGNNKQNLLAEEKGFSTYNKVDDAECKIAYDWWEKNEKKWTSVRDIWIEIFEKEENISLKEKVNGKKLYEFLLFSDKFEKYEDQKSLINSFIN